MEEIWKPVVGYESFYEISSLGNCRNIKTGKLLKPSIGKPHRYYRFILFDDIKKTSINAHRIVAKAFIPNPDNKPQVHHINHNKEDNRVCNLQWVTASENTKAAVEAGRQKGAAKMGVRHHNGKFTDLQISWIKKLRSDFNISMEKLAEIFNTNSGYIGQILKGKKRAIINTNYNFPRFCKGISVLSVYPQPVTNF